MKSIAEFLIIRVSAPLSQVGNLFHGIAKNHAFSVQYAVWGAVVFGYRRNSG